VVNALDFCSMCSVFNSYRDLVLVASVLWYCWLGAVLGFCWQKPVSVRHEVETGSNWFKPKRPKIVVHWYRCCHSNRISTISYKTNTVTHLCILSHTSCFVKCVSTQMKTAREAKIRLWKMTLLNITIITQRCNSLTFLCYSLAEYLSYAVPLESVL